MINRQIVGSRMSKIVEHNGVIYFAGIVPTDKTVDVKGQTLEVLNIAKDLFSPKRTYVSAVLEYLFLKYPAPEKWVYGKPFLQENENMNSIEIPVRVWSKQSYYDMWIYISSTGTAEYIDQVQLGSVIVE